MSAPHTAVVSWDEATAAAIIARHAHREGAMLPILHALQEEFGCVPPPAHPLIADALNVSRAEVHGVVSFYRDFRVAPPEGRVVQVCRAEACRAVGCEAMLAELEARHGLVPDRAGQGVALRTVYCLGNCALGPAALVEGELHARLDADSLAALCGRPVAA